jgi:hypothetical protein
VNEIQGGGDTPPQFARTRANAEVAALVETWFSLLVCPSEAIRATQRLEIDLEIVELLRRGYSAAQLEASMREDSRDRTEYPRHWRARVSRRAPQARRSPLINQARTRAQLRAEQEEAARSRKEALKEMGVQTLAEAMKERQRGRR